MQNLDGLIIRFRVDGGVTAVHYTAAYKLTVDGPLYPRHWDAVNAIVRAG